MQPKWQRKTLLSRPIKANLQQQGAVIFREWGVIAPPLFKFMNEQCTPETPNPVGRPRLDLDPNLIEDLAGIGCTMIEISKICKCSVDTLERNFADVIEKGREEMKMSLRRRQLEVAHKGSKDKEVASVTMLIWLGKQHLNQRDKQEITGVDGGAIVHEHGFDLTRLSTEQLEQLRDLVESATADVGTGRG